jgi:DNA-binding XRE family transcriptional regulator
MKRITQLRVTAGHTRARLGALAAVHPARVGQIENGRYVPYNPELKRLARALRYQGNPQELLEEVGHEEA